MGQVTLQQANAIIDAAFQRAQENGFYPLTVAVVDAGGHVISVQRQDGGSIMRPQIAIGKASGALGLGISGRFIGELAEAKPTVFSALSNLSPHGVIPGPGAVIIVDEQNKPIGAVGVTGDTSDNDELCAYAAIEATGLRAQGR